MVRIPARENLITLLRWSLIDYFSNGTEVAQLELLALCKCVRNRLESNLVSIYAAELKVSAVHMRVLIGTEYWYGYSLITHITIRHLQT